MLASAGALNTESILQDGGRGLSASVLGSAGYSVLGEALRRRSVACPAAVPSSASASSGKGRLGAGIGGGSVKGGTAAPRGVLPAAGAADGEPEEEQEGVWTAAKWLQQLNIPQIVARALRIPPSSQGSAFEYVRKMRVDDIADMLVAAQLGGLADEIVRGVAALRKQETASSAQLNDKFQATGKFQMSYGSLSLFYGGLESLLGPPSMVKDPEMDGKATLLKAMENEHTTQPDCQESFTSSNGVCTTSATEWEVVKCPDKAKVVSGDYPERYGMRESHPNWCRIPVPLGKMLERMESEANARLRAGGHSEMIVEELVAGRLYSSASVPLPPGSSRCTHRQGHPPNSQQMRAGPDFDWP